MAKFFDLKVQSAKEILRFEKKGTSFFVLLSTFRNFAHMMTENPYVKQFPELMAGKTVLYCHGFASSGQSGTVTRLREVMPQAKVVAPDLPIHPEEAIVLLKEVCQKEKPALIIGTSMGGMYAEQLYGFDRICVNPAMEMGETMKAHGMTGTQQFQNPRLDGVQEFYVDKALVKEYKDQSEHRFEGITDEERQRVFGLFGDEDTTVDTFDMFHTHYPNAIHFHGEHRMNDRSFMHSVVPVIRWIDDRQERRERPIVYIDVRALCDQRGQPRSSAQKTVRQLLERYQLYFVAAAPADSRHYADTLQWLYEHINVPAWGHTVFTNQKPLLYGDYLIDVEKTEGMAALIHFGSDTFKTWDDIAVYFSRLGGQ